MAGTPISLTPLQAHVDDFVGLFSEQSTDWKTLAAFSAGGFAWRTGRLGLASLSEGSFGKLTSLVAGLSSEVAAFEMTQRGLNRDARLWRWNGAQGLKAGLLSSTLTFGSLKGLGRIAQGENLLVQHLLQDTAMVGSHQVASGLGWMSKPQGSLVEQFLHSEATLLQIGAAGALIPALAPSLNAVERGLDLSLKTGEGLFPFPSFAGKGLALGTAAASMSGSGEKANVLDFERVSMSSRGGDASYPGLSLFPNTFKNGEIFHVAKTNGIPDGLPMLRIDEKKDHSPEDTIVQAIEAHLQKKKLSRRGPEPFLAYYTGTRNADPTQLKQKLQRVLNESIPEGFLLAVAMPHASVPMAYSYKKKRGGVDLPYFSQTRLNAQAPDWSKGTVATPRTPPVAEDSGHHSLVTPIPAEAVRPGSSAPAMKAVTTARDPAPAREVGRTRELLSRTQTSETLSDLVQTFRQVLGSMPKDGKPMPPESWFLNLNRAFIELKASELQQLEDLSFDPITRGSRATLQNRLHQKIKMDLVDPLAEALKEHTLPEGQTINIRWTSPLPASLKIHEEKGSVRITVSGNKIPVQDYQLVRNPLTGGFKVDVFRRNASFASSESAETSDSASSPPAGQKPGSGPQSFLTCASREEALEKLVDWLKPTNPESSATFELKHGILDTSDFAFLGNLLDERSLAEGGQLRFTWRDHPSGSLLIEKSLSLVTARYEVSGSPPQNFILKTDLMTGGRRWDEAPTYR